ncbi:MAG: 4Fe-4S binding protein [Anaerolineae bacterium]|nr:4Fe-4S binding protein [Anaerolineae bacterium]
MAANISAIVLAIIFVLMSVLGGRLFCGKICPYGLLQDLLNKIPFPKKIRSFKGDIHLRHLKYILLVLMLVVNLFGYSTAPTNETNSFDAGKTIWWTVVTLISIVISRPACKYLCPVGLLLGWSNLFPFGQYKVNQDSCTQCGACLKVCPMDIKPYQSANHFECIQCGKCKKVCPSQAITTRF